MNTGTLLSIIWKAGVLMGVWCGVGMDVVGNVFLTTGLLFLILIELVFYGDRK